MSTHNRSSAHVSGVPRRREVDRVVRDAALLDEGEQRLPS
jgi:hypothetical protein